MQEIYASLYVIADYVRTMRASACTPGGTDGRTVQKESEMRGTHDPPGQRMKTGMEVTMCDRANALSTRHLSFRDICTVDTSFFTAIFCNIPLIETPSQSSIHYQVRTQEDGIIFFGIIVRPGKWAKKSSPGN